MKLSSMNTENLGGTGTASRLSSTSAGDPAVRHLTATTTSTAHTGDPGGSASSGPSTVLDGISATGTNSGLMPNGFCEEMVQFCNSNEEALIAEKLVVVGDAAVGKTSLISRYCFDKFDINTTTTVGVDFIRQRYKILGRDSFEICIWDTAGQERFKSMLPFFARGAGAIVLAFDLTSRVSFENVRFWLTFTAPAAQRESIVVLAGLKCDSPGRLVSKEEAKHVAASLGSHYFECSSKENINVHVMFDSVARMLFNQAIKLRHQNALASGGVSSPHSSSIIRPTGSESTKGKCCH
ncbi:RAB36 member RAS oncogene family protein [Pelomyxa schiedti]|nr:RAB36 member RAS oncogene family protein [Pelomyxa schiedti]